MEEKAFSSEQPEEVIELLDIVGQSAGEDSGTVSRQDAPRPLAAGEEAVSAEPAGEEVLDLEESMESPVQSGDDLPKIGGDAEGRDVPPQQEFSAGAQQDAPAAASAVPEEGEGDLRAAFEERLRTLEENHRAAVLELEARLAAAEKACAELAENVESLSQQLAQAGAMFLEDASVRLNMEEMVSHMLDARLPALPEQEEESSSREEALAARVDELERRMDEGQARSEQMAALAAAKVIREEIAAMKAAVVPSGN